MKNRLRGAESDDETLENLRTNRDGIQIHVLVGAVEASSARTEYDSRRAGGGEESGVRPKRHAGEMNGACHVEHGFGGCDGNGRVGRDLVRRARGAFAEGGAKFGIASGKAVEERPEFGFHLRVGFSGECAALDLQTALRGIAGDFCAARNHRGMERRAAKPGMRRRLRELAVEAVEQ
jgi:hypothetical protein